MSGLNRRHLIASGAVFGAANLAGLSQGWAQATTGAACNTDLTPTQAWESPPEYLAGSPERASFLEAGFDGERVDLTGRIVTTQCVPLAHARIEFWHTDPAGKYDMAGFKRRGFQYTDADGRFRLETMMPGYYTIMRHVHFLIGAKMPGRSQPLLLTNVVELPKPEEYKTVPETPGRSRRPAAITRENGVFRASYDIIVAVS